MNTADVINYLENWIKLHAQEVYGSPRDYVSIWELQSELRTLKNNIED